MNYELCSTNTHEHNGKMLFLASSGFLCVYFPFITSSFVSVLSPHFLDYTGQGIVYFNIFAEWAHGLIFLVF